VIVDVFCDRILRCFRFLRRRSFDSSADEIFDVRRAIRDARAEDARDLLEEDFAVLGAIFALDLCFVSRSEFRDVLGCRLYSSNFVQQVVLL